MVQGNPLAKRSGSMARLTVRKGLLFGLLLASAACGAPNSGDTGGGGGSGSGDENSGAAGIVWKGPMEAGSSLMLTPMSGEGEALGAGIPATVSADDGSFSATIAHRGLVLIEATGVVFDEARGEAGDEVKMVAWGLLESEEQSLNVNILTDLTHRRMARLLVDGTPFPEAQKMAEGELHRALAFGLMVPPEGEGRWVDPWGSGFDQSYLFAASSVLAQAGREQMEAGTGGLPELMDQLREDLEADGLVDPALSELLRDAETRLDPDLAVLSLSRLVEVSQLGRELPDPHPALDSDHDGIANDQDNCRYFANPDQAETLGTGFGDACDYRLSQIATAAGWGCGILAASGELTCWDLKGEPTGGTPPRPDVFPSHVGAPWGEGEGLSGTFNRIAMAQGALCGRRASGGVDCWSTAGAPRNFTGDWREIALTPGHVGLLDDTGRGQLYSLATGALVRELTGLVSLQPFGPDAVCGLTIDGQIRCMDTLTEFYPVGADADTYAAIAGTAEGTGALCALSDVSRAPVCFGEAPFLDGAPSEGGWSEITLGGGIACVSAEDGERACWRDEDMCPPAGEEPGVVTGLSAGICEVCGVDEDGLGVCWPRLWDQNGPEAEG